MRSILLDRIFDLRSGKANIAVFRPIRIDVSFGFSSELANSRQGHRIESKWNDQYQGIPRIITILSGKSLASAPVHLDEVKLGVKFGVEYDVMPSSLHGFFKQWLLCTKIGLG